MKNHLKIKYLIILIKAFLKYIFQFFLVFFFYYYLQSSQNHSPTGTIYKSTHSRWNHSIGQFGPSQAIISPPIPSCYLHLQYLLSSSFWIL